MSWRRFLVLIRGLSPHSATIAHLHQEEIGGKRSEKEVVIDGTPEEVDRAFDALFRPPKQAERTH